MPGKKKKYNARFPPARIKKIMQTDEEVGKVAAAVPVIISRALELFVQSLLTKAGGITTLRHARTLTPSHLKQCIISEQRFDFLQELFSSVSNIGSEGDIDVEPTIPLPVPLPPSTTESLSFCQIKQSDPVSTSNLEVPPSLRGRGRGRGRGRPRKSDTSIDSCQPTAIKRPRGRPRKVNNFIAPSMDIDEESNDGLEVDLEASDTEGSEGESSRDAKFKVPVAVKSTSQILSCLNMDDKLQPTTKSLNNSLLGGIQITIPQVGSTPIFSGPNNGSLSAPVSLNGASGIPVPVITSLVDLSKRTSQPALSSQVDEDYDC